MILGSVSPSSVWAARVLPSEVARRPAISVVQQSHALSKHDKAKRNKERIVFPLSACLDCMKRMAALLPRVPHPSAAACLQPRAARGGLIQNQNLVFSGFTHVLCVVGPYSVINTACSALACTSASNPLPPPPTTAVYCFNGTRPQLLDARVQLVRHASHCGEDAVQ